MNDTKSADIFINKTDYSEKVINDVVKAVINNKSVSLA